MDKTREHQCPLCVLQASLWSSDCTQQLDTVQIVQRRSSSSKAQLNPLRALTGTLTSSPSILRDLDNELGIYFAFPDISVRVAQTYRLKFDLLLISEYAYINIYIKVYSVPLFYFFN